MADSAYSASKKSPAAKPGIFVCRDGNFYGIGRFLLADIGILWYAYDITPAAACRGRKEGKLWQF